MTFGTSPEYQILFDIVHISTTLHISTNVYLCIILIDMVLVNSITTLMNKIESRRTVWNFTCSIYINIYVANVFAPGGLAELEHHLC